MKHCHRNDNFKTKELALFAAIVLVSMLAAACAAFCAGVHAQAFPSKPIHIVVPYPAGGTTDLMARALQEPMQKTLGQPVIVDNKPGAAGAIAIRCCVNASLTPGSVSR